MIRPVRSPWVGPAAAAGGNGEPDRDGTRPPFRGPPGPEPGPPQEPWEKTDWVPRIGAERLPVPENLPSGESWEQGDDVRIHFYPWFYRDKSHAVDPLAPRDEALEPWERTDWFGSTSRPEDEVWNHILDLLFSPEGPEPTDPRASKQGDDQGDGANQGGDSDSDDDAGDDDGTQQKDPPVVVPAGYHVVKVEQRADGTVVYIGEDRPAEQSEPSDGRKPLPTDKGETAPKTSPEGQPKAGASEGSPRLSVRDAFEDSQPGPSSGGSGPSGGGSNPGAGGQTGTPPEKKPGKKPGKKPKGKTANKRPEEALPGMGSTLPGAKPKGPPGGLPLPKPGPGGGGPIIPKPRPSPDAFEPPKPLYPLPPPQYPPALPGRDPNTDLPYEEPGLEGTWLNWIFPSEDDFLWMLLLGPFSGKLLARFGPAIKGMAGAFFRREGHHVIPQAVQGPHELYRLGRILHDRVHKIINEELGKRGLPPLDAGKKFIWDDLLKEYPEVRGKVVDALREAYERFDAKYKTKLLKRLEEILQGGHYPH